MYRPLATLLLIPLTALAQQTAPSSPPRIPLKAGSPNFPSPDILDVDVIATPQQLAAYLDFQEKNVAARLRGETLWGSESWMKSPDYYKKLDTTALALECFDRTLFYWEMQVFDDPQYGFIRLRTMHDGFAELFTRKDIAAALPAVYRAHIAQLQPENKDEVLFRASATLSGLQYLYLLPGIQQQVKGHEADLLQVHIEALQAYRAYIAHYESKHLPIPKLFYADAPAVANASLAFLKRTNPPADAAIRANLKNFHWPQPQTEENQKMEDVATYLDIFLTRIPAAATRPKSQ